MRRAAIVTPLRTPVGTFGGSLRPVSVEELAATTVRAVVEKSGIDPARIDDVVFAQSYASSETPRRCIVSSSPFSSARLIRQYTFCTDATRGRPCCSARRTNSCTP